MFDLEYKGQIDGAQHLQWYHSMANIKIYKDYKITLDFTIFEILAFPFITLKI